MPLWRRARGVLVDAVYPRTCAGCGMRGTWLCEWCLESVPRMDQRMCNRCGHPVAGPCRMCRHLDSGILRARSAFPYTGWVASAIRSFKYADEYDRANELAERMMPALADLGSIDLIVPVPLYPAKLNLRGYNQSALLARYLAEDLGVRMCEGLVRTRNTVPQVQLGRDDRHANVHDAFAVSPNWAPPPGLRLLLVDDVRTTGATLSACARALQQVQPSIICVATLAVDVPSRELDAWLDATGHPSAAM